MNVDQDFGVAPGKVAELRSRMARLGIDSRDIEESFVLGGGPGGQKINKTANCVALRYAPMDLRIRCQADRRRAVNRFLALRELVDRIEMAVSPDTSLRLREVARLRRNKHRAHRRATQRLRSKS